VTTPSTKTEVIGLIERVRRAMPLNRDVMAVCDLLERSLLALKANVASTSEPVASTRRPAVASTDCDDCRRRRASKAKAQGRWRSKQRDPMTMKIIGQTENKAKE
jgi:hypothetical protein